MARILIVDDRPINREFLATLLGYLDHQALHAADGAEALVVARAHHPDLVITDVLMPIMDGVEFVAQLRADPSVAGIPVIFYTATYRLNETIDLAKQCGVATVLSKPAAPQTIIDAVAAALGGSIIDPTRRPEPAPSGKHSTWLAGLLRPKTNGQALPAEAVPPSPQTQLPSAAGLSLRLATLIEMGLELAAERNIDRMLEIFIGAARDIMSAKYAAVALIDRERRGVRLAMRGLPDELRPELGVAAGVLGRMLSEPRPQRLVHISPDDLPPGHPPVSGLLALPVCSAGPVYGWLYFADNLLSGVFSEDDEQIAVTLSTTLSLACENLLLIEAAQDHARHLETEVTARERARSACGNSPKTSVKCSG